MIYIRRGLNGRIASSLVILLFLANITAADYALAQETAKCDRLKSETVSDIAYDANTLVGKEAAAVETISMKNELLKNQQSANPAAKVISTYDQKERYEGLFSGSAGNNLLKEKEYSRLIDYFAKEPPPDKNAGKAKDRAPLVILPDGGISLDMPIGDNMEKIGEIDGRPIYRLIEDDKPKTPPHEPRPLTDQEKQEIADMENFIYDLAKALFDTDGDGDLDDADKYGYEPGGTLDIGAGGLPISKETYDLLKRIFVKLVWYNKAASLDINGIHIDIVTGDPDGSLTDGLKITISDGKRTITFNYIPPPGVGPSSIKKIKITFLNLQDTRKRLSDKMDAAERKISDRPKNGPPVSNPDGNNCSESTAAAGMAKAASSAGKSVLKNNAVRKKTSSGSVNIVHNQSRPVKRDDIRMAAGPAEDGYKLLRTEWRSEKSALDKAIEHILTEDAGAVYTNSGDTINAIILLKATDSTNNNDENKDDGSGESG